MKKLIPLLIAILCILELIGCTNKLYKKTDTPGLKEISDFAQEQLEEKLIGISQEELHDSWGEPDGQLYGFFGETWSLDNGNDKYIIIYYDNNGNVLHIKVNETD
ncbi:MAG: hypothetical protein ACI4Q5_00485 [Porcipelethomonas sp.]